MFQGIHCSRCRASDRPSYSMRTPLILAYNWPELSGPPWKFTVRDLMP